MKTRFQPNIIIGLALAFLLLAGNSLWSQTLTATDNSNDAYIDVDWSLPVSCMDTVGGKPYSKGVYLELKAGTKVIYTETIKQTNATAVTNTFRHFVGPNQSLNYTLTLYVVGPGNIITDCTIAANAGSTLAFQAPQMVSASDATAADRVTISWKNKSKLSSNFIIVRKSGSGERIIATIPGTTQIDSVFTYEDIYRFDDSTSIVNGESYTYCIRTYSNLTKSTFDEVGFPAICEGGSTFDINLSASDFTLPNRVELTWTDPSLYADEISIQRNGEIIATILNPAATSYTDNNPIYGFTSTYEVVLVKNGAQTVSSIDTGGVNPIGVLSGFVRNDDGFGIAGAKVFYTATIFDVEYADSTLTDYTGAYSFTNLFFGVSSTFIIKAKHDDFEVKADSIIVTLSTSTPVSQNNNFTSAQTFDFGVPVITIDNFTATPGSDQLTLSWTYTSNPPADAADTIFFQLYREGQLIGIIDDAAGTPMQLVDLTAEPSYFYKYELRAYTFVNDSVRTAVAVDTFQFPMVTTPTNVAAVNNFDANSMDVITVTWNHSSTNFDGFRVYRDNVLLKEITDITIRNYTDYMGNPGASYTYAVSAFRIANNIPYESDRIPASSVAYPDFTEVTNVVATPQNSENAVEVTWNSTSGMGDNFTGFKVLRNGTEIGEIIKGTPYLFKDLQGTPGTSYTYSVKLFVEQEDTIFLSTGVAAAAVNFPTIDAVPSMGFSAPASSGKVNLTWNAAYNTGHQNYDGFILEAPGVTGIEADTIDRYRTDYTFYNKTNTSVTFSIKAYRNINGVIYTSAATTTNASASNALATLEAPSTVRASNKYPMHLAISWEYPVYKLSKFIILKDGTALDTLPPSARNYYDYDALPGVLHEYQVQAYYNNTLSDKVGAAGVRKNLGTLQGQVLSEENGRGADSLEVRLLNGTTVLDRTFTNTAGFYIFEDLPLTASQGTLTAAIQTSGRSTTIPGATLNVTPTPLVNQTVTLNFLDQLLLPEYPPRLQRDSVVQILAAEAQPLKNTRGVAFSWAVSEGLYDGFNTYRGFTTLPNTANAPALFLIDKGGSGGIGYNYPVAAFKSTAEELLTSVPAGVDSAVFPIFLPVENLSATPGYSGNDNTVIINWSRCTDEVSFYQIERNDEVLGLIAAGNPLTFEDNEGKPNQQYTYTVRAAIQNGAQLTYSEPVSVTIIYPNVAAPEFTLTPLPDSNAVNVSWTYNGEYVNGFRIYRDGNLIASLNADATAYLDIEGTPGAAHEYTVEAILERDGMAFFSENVAKPVTFPVLRSVVNPMVQSNLNLGNAQLMFNYYARGVDQFEIEYTITYNSGSATQTFFVSYNDLVNNKITFIDELAVPGVAVNYMVTAISVRNNVEYRSASLTASLGSYPRPPVPANFTATDGTFENRVEMDWVVPFEANIDGFVILRFKDAGPTSLAASDIQSYIINSNSPSSPVADTFVVGPGRRTFAEAFNQIGNNTPTDYDYVIVSFNEAYGVTYYSMGATDIGFPGIQNDTYNKFTDPNATSTFGWAVSVDNGKAVVGAPQSNGGQGKATWYSKSGTQWNKTTDITYSDRPQFGYDVAIAKNITSVGAPASTGTGGAPNAGAMMVFDNGVFPVNTRNYVAGTTDLRYGADVAIATSDVGTSNVYNTTENQAQVYIYTNNGLNYSGSNPVNSPVAGGKYVALGASDSYVVAGAASELINVRDFIDIYRRNGDNFNFVSTTYGEQNGDNFGMSVDVSGDYMAVGADKKSSGSVYIYKLRDGNWTQIQRIDQPLLPNNTPSDRFGFSVALDGEFLVIGANKHQNIGTTMTTGLAFLYKREGDLYRFIEPISMPSNIGANNDGFGFDVDVSGSDILIGAPYHDTKGAVFFYSIDLLELWDQRLSNVQATDGTLPNQTRITWNFTGNRNYINGFNIYRDDDKIGSVNGSQSIFFDTDGLPGKEYVYTVKVETNEDRETIGKADKGFRPGNGSLEALVQTLIGSSPVPGVEIEAEGIAGGEKYTYKGLTNGNGTVQFRNVFIGTDTITYTFRASYGNHEFVQNPISVSLTTDNKIGRAIFIDQTAFVVTGKVQLQNVTCGIDSVRLRAISTFQNAADQFKEVYTNSDGDYSLVVEPDKAGLQQIRIVIDSTHVISRVIEGMEQRDTVLHKFKASAATVFTNFVNFPISQTVNFDDTLTYETKLFVTTVCKTPASNNGLFNIEISTRDGCFQQFYTTGINGRVNAKLPPLDDLIVTVKEVTPAQVANILIVDYLRYRPNTLDLLTIHLDNRTEQYDAETLDSLTFQRLVYHKPPEITLLTSFDRVFCGSDDLIPIISQNRPYSFDFSVEELHNGFNCKVDEGYLIINNSAATIDRDTLRFLPDENKFETHDFTAGLPNLVFPYRKGINVKYFSANNDFLGEIILPIIVEGSTTLPGSDILVDLGDPDGQFKFISYILRDPSGDGSFSSITENSTVRKTYTRVNSGRFAAGLDTDFTFGTATGGFYVKGQITAGFSRLDRKSFDIISTTSQTITTSNAPNFVGPDADVLVGVGVAFRYGIGETLQYDSTTCKMVSIREFTFGPDSIKTDWFYTVGILKQFVKELKAQQRGVLNGTVRISVGGRQLNQGEATERLQTQIENWEAVLNYHAVTSLPHVMFCSQEPKINFTSDLRQFLNQNGLAVISADIDNTKSSRESNAKTARNEFCNKIGSYAGDVFTLSDEVLFNETLKNSYQEAVTKASYWVDSLTYIYSILKNKVDNISTSESFFPEIENTTFSAGTTISKSTTSTLNSLDVIEQRGFFVVDQSFGYALGAKGGTVIGLGAAVSAGLLDIKNKVGIVIKASYEGGTNEETATSNTTTYSYTLNDNDPGDQFSVTAIKGRQKGHSPYFQLFGGRSSCPPEPGTINRDQVDLALIDLPTLATFDELTLNDLNPNSPAKFNLQITNRSPFGESRDIFIYHDATTNEEGAILNLSGQRLGGSNEAGQTLNFLNANQPYIQPLTIDRAPGKYQFEGIRVIARPSCPDGSALRDSLGKVSRDTVVVSAFFQTPCSPITIASPGDNWVIRRRNPFIQESRENLILEIRDYQAKNTVLEEMYLEVRRIGDGSGWRQIPTRELDPPYVVLNDSLIVYNEANFAPGDIPKFFFVWDITELYQKYPDGDYEIRAVSFCGSSGVIFSNLIQGRIARSTNTVFAITQPADGIWQRGDDISIRVNKEINCNLPQDSIKFEVIDLLTGLPVPGTVGCFSDNNTLVFQPTDITAYDDRILRATVYDLTDESGNVYLDTFTWDFRVIYRDIFVEDDSLYIRIYKGNTDTISTTIFANQQVGTIGFTATPNQPWVLATPSPSTTNSVSGRVVNFIIDTDNLPLGNSQALITVQSQGAINPGTDQIRLFVEVVPTPPDWVVDPTKFSDLIPLNVIANWKYNNVPGLANDTLDLISAWIGNEIRGVAPITNAGGGFFAAYIPVYGNSPADVNKLVEFRVWDASLGIEYDARPVIDTMANVIDTIRYQSGNTIGTTQSPKVMLVDPNKDRARYIPLNPNGWTWFSLNSTEPNMRVNRILRELQNGQSGDVVRTRDKAASFLPGSGWISASGGLDTMRVIDGFAIYRTGPADSIRITGTNARYPVIPLQQGWNFVGYPRQDERGVNDILDLLTPTNLDQVFTSRSVLDNNAASLSQYIGAPTNSWIPGAFTFKPNRAYQIFVNTPTVWILEGSVANPLQSPKPILEKNLTIPDPNIPGTWAVNPADFSGSMIVVADLAFDKQISLDANDKIGAFINGECRGTANVQFVPELNKYIATVFVYNNRAGEQVEFRLFDASANKVYRHTERLAFSNNKVIGNVAQPYHFVNLSLPQGTLTATEVRCATDSSGVVRVSNIEGGIAPYKVRWENGQEGLERKGLTAGMYRIQVTDNLGQVSSDSIEIVNQQITIPTPAVDVNGGKALCRDEDVWLEAQSEFAEAAYRWYDASGKLLGTDGVFSIANARKDTTLYVEANVSGCLSPRIAVPLKIQSPDAAFTILPSAIVPEGDTIYLRPSAGVNAAYAYQWMLDGNTISRLPEISYAVEKAGLYDLSLRVRDAEGCEATIEKDNFLQVLLATAVDNISLAVLKLSAAPNPFVRQVTVTMDVEKGGEYLLNLRDMAGRTLWRQKQTLIAGRNESLLDFRNTGLAEGAYLLEVSNKEGEKAIIKLIKRATP